MKPRKRRKHHNDGDGQYMVLSYSLLNSEAWRTLSGPAVKVFLELRTRFHGGNNGKLHMSLEEAAGLLKLGKATVMRAFKELEERGLILCTRRGQWYGRMASEWAVGDKGIDGVLPSYRWKQWRPPGPPRASVLKWTEKTKRGSEMKPSGVATGPLQNRELGDGSATEPVRAPNVLPFGSEMSR
jgi:DNA-binding transcriptional ArsR family regulator